jgi:outer membrane biosynthesis protein TonB
MVATRTDVSEDFLKHMNDVKSDVLEGGFQPRLRSGTGATADDAVKNMEAAQKLETGPKFRDATGKAPPVEKAPADTGKPKARPAKAAEPEVAPPPKRTPEAEAKVKKQKERVAEKQPKKMADVKKPRRQAAAEQTDLFEASAKQPKRSLA